MKVANSKCRALVQQRKSFEGSNLYSRVYTNLNPDENWYVVYSYGEHWPLFIYANGCWFENEEKASQTTSKHRSQAHPHTNTILLSTTWMKRLAQGGWAAIAKERILSRPDQRQSQTEALMAFMGG
jgi:hypothetical protein